ncbi:kinase-like protein [Dissoconium aciculare CBS 342.82]|uniref:non-specific serine/threonine protein kinase n=1 Tax=Dissoconium aciculare CBS 342.82 TaxID=1314786 RepID=A0A6J3MAU7_9PEZI|nr:kinase-like protein [Dissoconium aciculare CBS 342.82]KAF1823952.1 kinase-like protein [Dissoconium aciculare CBS 342.82]
MSRWLKKGLQSAKGHLADATQATQHNVQKFAQANAASSPLVEGYYEARAHERFNDGRYEAIRRLGTGQYSHVWLADDLHRNSENSQVALKLLTTDCYGGDHDIFEVEILNRIAEQQRLLSNAARNSHVIGSLDSFRLRGPAGEHRCIVMPVLGSSLGQQVHRFPNRRIPVKTTKEIVKQLLQGMASGESADSVTPTIDSTIGKFTDLSEASWVDKHLSDRIQPEHLRAPEVFLGAPWGPPCDIWSLGCLIVEFIQGFVLFDGKASQRGTWTSEDDHLAQHMEVLGPMPSELL